MTPEILAACVTFPAFTLLAGFVAGFGMGVITPEIPVGRGSQCLSVCHALFVVVTGQTGLTGQASQMSRELQGAVGGGGAGRQGCVNQAG